jgi:hypothetical protein
MPRIKAPSPSMAIALLALFVALGGTGYAAVKINGKNIKNKTISGKKVKKNTLTGTQIRESKLGKVPKAKVADSAATAGALSGQARAGFLASEKVVSTGLIKLPAVGNSAAGSPAKALFTKGPFTVSAKCYTDGADANKEKLIISATSSEPGSDLDGVIGANTFVTGSQAGTAGTFTSGIDGATFATPSGRTLALSFHNGVNGFGSACFTAISALSHP